VPSREGSFHLFRLFGIDVYLHYAWFLAVVYFVSQIKGYSTPLWSAGECVGMFLIVLTHEFGHQLACRSVGGTTHEIVLWPLGGVAFVTPPPRPGAELWSIAAGPLVNAVLVPIFALFVSVSWHSGWYATHPEAFRFLNDIWRINLGLLCFNLLPIYPLDGGQILRSLLWFVLGRANSLLVASIIGFGGVVILVILSLFSFIVLPNKTQAAWGGVIAFFILINCWGGLKYARALARIAKLPRREGFACPACKAAPPAGEYWRCAKCGKVFDTFQTSSTCPHCGVHYEAAQCLECGTARPVSEWSVTPPDTGIV
jgi:Zn-dependent protease